MGQTNVNVSGDGSSGMGAGMIVGLVLAIVIIGFVVWYFLLNGGGGGEPSDSSAPLQSLVQSILPTSTSGDSSPDRAVAASLTRSEGTTTSTRRAR